MFHKPISLISILALIFLGGLWTQESEAQGRRHHDRRYDTQKKYHKPDKHHRRDNHRGDRTIHKPRHHGRDGGDDERIVRRRPHTKTDIIGRDRHQRRNDVVVTNNRHGKRHHGNHHGKGHHKVRKHHKPHHKIHNRHRRHHNNVTIINNHRYDHPRRHHSRRHVTVVKRPAHHSRHYRTVYVNNRRCYYNSGRFYRRVYDRYEFIPAPIGAIVVSIPVGCATVTIGGVTYYEYEDTYFVRVSRGYRVVERPGFHLSMGITF